MIHKYLLLSLFGICACFLSSTVAREAIVNGMLTDHREYPYQVSVQIRGRGHVCGGGIIDERFILTAAHCLLNRTRRLHSRNIYVLAGSDSLNRTGPPAVYKRVEKVFFPTEFHPAVEFNVGDLAVLKLANSLPLHRHSNLRKLNFTQHSHSSVSATVAGYGWNQYERVGNEGVGRTDGRLRYADAFIVTTAACEATYPLGIFRPDRHLCAMSVGFSQEFGVCNGDGGSPLLRKDGSNRAVIGILSRIPPHCDERVQPGVYTYIEHYIEMIVNVMKYGGDLRMISLNC